MECNCIRHTDFPHTSKLFADLVYNPDRVRAFYPHIPGDPGVYEAIAREIDFSPQQRAALVSALREQNGTSPSLDLLAREGTVAVVTGQQVGLFSGPAYTIYKALTAVKLTRELSERGIPAVPVFWLATEDHDFAEVNQCWVFDSEHHPVKLQEDRAPVSNQPVGQLIMSAPPTAQLREVLSAFPFGGEVASLVEEAYQPGQTLGQAFSIFLKKLLAKYDLLHVDPMAPSIRRLAAPAMRATLEQAPQLTTALLQRKQELEAAGYHAQVHIEDQTSLLFLLENGRRNTLRRYGSDYLQNGRRFTAAELAERADHLSPNALLRPVVQDSILPTIAYIGGPAELAYLAQSEVIYRTILGRMPAALHRASFTLLDSRSRKVMNRYGLTLSDCAHGEDHVRERIAAKLIPSTLANSVTQTKSAVEQSVDRLLHELTGFDASLAAALGKSQKKILHQISKMEAKIGREAMARNARVSEDAAYLSNLLYPNRHLQERLYSILPFVARHGTGLIDDLYGCLRLECPDHQLATV